MSVHIDTEQGGYRYGNQSEFWSQLIKILINKKKPRKANVGLQSTMDESLLIHSLQISVDYKCFLRNQFTFQWCAAQCTLHLIWIISV